MFIRPRLGLDFVIINGKFSAWAKISRKVLTRGKKAKQCIKTISMFPVDKIGKDRGSVRKILPKFLINHRRFQEQCHRTNFSCHLLLQLKNPDQFH